MRVTLIHNPAAGDESFSASELTALIEKAGHKVLHRSIKKDYVSALRMPADLVVVAGGDGTVRKVAMAILKRNIPIAIWPCGTANNIAKSLGISGSPLELIAGWPEARQKGFDVGIARGPRGEVRFLEGIGLGVFSGAMAVLEEIDYEHDIEFDDAEQKLHSDISALKAAVSQVPAHDVTITIDEQSFAGRFVLIEAMNIKSVGPNLLLAPDADPSDGLLDFVFVAEHERDEMMDYLTQHRQSAAASPRVTIHRGKRLRMTWEGATVHVDDQIWLGEEGEASNNLPPAVIEVTLERNTLRFLVP